MQAVSAKAAAPSRAPDAGGADGAGGAGRAGRLPAWWPLAALTSNV